MYTFLYSAVFSITMSKFVVSLSKNLAWKKQHWRTQSTIISKVVVIMEILYGAWWGPGSGGGKAMEKVAGSPI